MKIAQVVLSLEVGGQERLLVRMARALHDRGHDVHVVTLTAGGALRSELGGITVHEVAKRPGLDFTLYRRLFSLFRALRPDVVHTHNSVPLEYAAPAAKALRIRTVHTKHGHIPYSKAALWLARAATRFVDRFVAVSDDTAVTAARWEKPARAETIENGIPLESFAPDASARAAARKELGIPDDAFVVGSVGRLVHEKDFSLLVRATPHDAWLVIVGEGAERARIEKEIGDRPRVILTGQRSDIPRLLCAFDLFVLSSKAEGLPLVIPEAMAAGLPVVATRVGGIPGIIPESTGTLVASGDEEALRKAIDRYRDPSLRASAAKAARTYALGRFSQDLMIDAYLALYAR